MISIFRSKNYWEANILKSLLETQGIQVTIKDGSILGTLTGEVGIDAAYSEVCVAVDTPKEQLEKIMTQFETAKKFEVVNHNPWRCPSCNEENEGNFAICWNCSSSKKAS